METNRKLKEIKKIIGKNDNTYCDGHQKSITPTPATTECSVYAIESSAAASASSTSSGSFSADTSDTNDEDIEDDDKNYEFDRIWECFKCHMIKINLNDLQSHFQQCLYDTIETRQLNFKCDTKADTSKFPSINKTDRPLKKLKPIECAVCFKQFKTRQQRNGHMQMHSVNRKSKSKRPVATIQSVIKSNALPSVISNKNPTLTVKLNGNNDKFKLMNKQSINVRAKLSKFKKCDVCGKRFSCEQNLHEHLKEFHMLNKKFECKVCRERFYTINNLIIHQNSHELNIRNFHCQYCNRKFLSTASVESHMKTIHMDVVNENGKEFK